MITWCYILAGILGVIVALYALLEIHYFLRMCLCVIFARFLKRNVGILDTTEVNGICLTTDIDTLLYHMNNARYLREIDFARVDFYERTKLYHTILQKGGAVVQGATTIRYRRFIRPFSIFKITSKIVYWDEQTIYMEHKFITKLADNEFVNCVAICRQRFINCSANEVMDTLLTLNNKNGLQQRIYNSNNINGGSKINGLDKIESGVGNNDEGVSTMIESMKPKLPPEIAKWIEYNNISSANLRSNC